MGKMQPRLWACAMGMILAIAGCSSQDTDCLARVARRVGERAEAITGGAEGRLASGLRAFRGDVDEMALDLRVSARLHWDKNLEGAQIHVQAQEGVVDLKGTVQTLEQRRRAVEVAESTVGTEKVNDGLEIVTAEP